MGDWNKWILGLENQSRYHLSDPVRVKQAMVKVDGDATPPIFGLGGFQIIISMSFVSKNFFLDHTVLSTGLNAEYDQISDFGVVRRFGS